MKKLLLSLVVSAFLAVPAMAACDMQKATAEFAQFTQKLAQENPEKFASSQGEFQNLMTEINTLAQAGKMEDICKKYQEFQAKFK